LSTWPQSLPARRALSPPRALTRLARIPLELVAVTALSLVLNLWALGQNGWANEYYSAAVRSMSRSWHLFLFGAFDPQGLMTVDKPPLSLWVQSLSVRVFGFHPLAMLVPEALMGSAAVVLTYDLVRRRFGRLGGAVAGLALATTPIAVAVSRHNNPDALLVLCCVGALWCFVRALENGRTRWLVLSGVCVGLGFETKMAVALVVVPAMAVAWLWCAPTRPAQRLRSLAAGAGAMLAVGGAWPLLVTLTPASDRPWISGTTDNSVWSLIVGYNGVGRISGQQGGPSGTSNQLFGGAPGPFRLVGEALGGQDGWLVGFALVAGLGLLVLTRARRRDPRTGWLLAVGGSALTTAVLFSFASGIFHPYYVSLLAPFVAMLVGAGVAEAWQPGRSGRILGAAALAGGVASTLAVLAHQPGQLTGLRVPLLVGETVAVVLLLLAGCPRVRGAALASAVGLLFIAPAVWSVDTLSHATNGTFPAGGPASIATAGGPGGMPGGAGQRAVTFRGGGGATGAQAPGGGTSSSLTSVLAYTRSHGGGTVVVESQSEVSQLIVEGATDVGAIGGFSGRESTVSTAWLAAEVKAGHIRWVLSSSGGTAGAGPGAGAGPPAGAFRSLLSGAGAAAFRPPSGTGRLPGDNRQGSAAAINATAKVCRKVTVNGSVIYDCAGRAAALAAQA
jgi:4-amino-4-deoxy-L-arabinose transferase-like glycosyltransferase